MEAKENLQARAVHHDGVLRLLDPVELPEGAQVRLLIQSISPGASGRLAFPTRLVPAARLDRLTALAALGGDALAETIVYGARVGRAAARFAREARRTRAKNEPDIMSFIQTILVGPEKAVKRET